jgi:hypothetical protein
VYLLHLKYIFLKICPYIAILDLSGW